ncbi:hypothetical protein HDU96_003279 [Phlyctochytrium bullatum]|nr:hypothetical protein HDU96_003279 [Phlyctochytrium bullatum]
MPLAKIKLARSELLSFAYLVACATIPDTERSITAPVYTSFILDTMSDFLTAMIGTDMRSIERIMAGGTNIRLQADVGHPIAAMVLGNFARLSGCSILSED